MKKVIPLLMCLAFGVNVNAQMKIGASTAPAAASVLELESTTQGFVLPRVSIADVTSNAPLGGTILTSTMVYNTNAGTTGGSGVGVYYWDGLKWNFMANASSSAITADNGLNMSTPNNVELGGVLTVPTIISATPVNTFTISSSGTAGGGISVKANSLNSGSAFDVSSNSGAGTGAGSDALIGLTRSGANSNASHTAYGIEALITNTGSSSTNVGGYFSASGATNNFGIIVPANGGNSGFGTSAPLQQIEVGGVGNTIRIDGIGSAGTTYYSSATTAASAMLYSNASGDVYSLPTANSSVLITSNTGVPSWSTAISNGLFWSLTGNALTSPGTYAAPGAQFIGTTDPQDFAVRTNGIERMRISSTGAVGINQNFSATQQLAVSTTTAANTAVLGQNTAAAGFSTGIGVMGSTLQSTGYGVYGINNNTTGVPSGATGVYGTYNSAVKGTGVAGIGTGGTNGYIGNLMDIGVYGSANTYGVWGNNVNGVGVYGSTANSVSSGVYGINTTTSAGASAIGVSGIKNGNTGTATGYGVYGQATGTGTNNYGGFFQGTGATNNYGVVVPSNGGNSGFGTTAPLRAVEVVSSTAALNTIRIDGLTAGTYNSTTTPANANSYLVYTDKTTGDLYSLTAPAVASVLVASATGVPSWSPTGIANGLFWSITGNSVTAPGTYAAPGANFIGTTDGQDLSVRTNGSERMRIASTGTIGVNQNFSATQQLAVSTAAAANTAIIGQNTAASGTGGNGFGVEGISSQSYNSTNLTNGYGTVALNNNASGTGLYAGGNNVGLNANYLLTGSGASLVGKNFGGFGYATLNSATTSSAGLYGTYNSSGFGIGVLGLGDNGTIPTLSKDIGVLGSANDYGVYGYGGAYGTYGNGSTYGVYGASASGSGVFGVSTSTGTSPAGVLGGAFSSTTGFGVVGLGGTTSAGYYVTPLVNGSTGSVGGTFTSGSNGFGITATRYGNNNVTGVAGGSFAGKITTSSPYTPTQYADVSYYDGATWYKIFGTGTVSSVLRGDWHDQRVIYAPEATEILLQDYGTGTLVNGKVHITIDPVLQKNITVNKKHPLKVFITLNDECNGVFVTNRTNTGFDVVELNKGTSNASFSYQIIANRADEYNDKGELESSNADIRLGKAAPAPLLLSTSMNADQNNNTISKNKSSVADHPQNPLPPAVQTLQKN